MSHSDDYARLNVELYDKWLILSDATMIRKITDSRYISANLPYLNAILFQIALSHCHPLLSGYTHLNYGPT